LLGTGVLRRPGGSLGTLALAVAAVVVTGAGPGAVVVAGPMSGAEPMGGAAGAVDDGYGGSAPIEGDASALREPAPAPEGLHRSTETTAASPRRTTPPRRAERAAVERLGPPGAPSVLPDGESVLLGDAAGTLDDGGACPIT
jgi:hypothetical protein